MIKNQHYVGKLKIIYCQEKNGTFSTDLRHFCISNPNLHNLNII